MNDELLAQLSTRVPLADRGQLARIVERIAATMATWAGPASRAALGSIVGDAPLRDRSPSRSIGLEALYDAVAEDTSTPRATARELTQSVALTIARALGPQARAHLLHDLPREWAPLVEDPHDVPVDHRPAPAVDRGGGHTLAAGRAGATVPLSDAASSGGQSDSVASSDDPGGARKLSSGEGPTPRGRDLATGRR